MFCIFSNVRHYYISHRAVLLVFPQNDVTSLDQSDSNFRYVVTVSLVQSEAERDETVQQSMIWIGAKMLPPGAASMYCSHTKLALIKTRYTLTEIYDLSQLFIFFTNFAR